MDQTQHTRRVLVIRLDCAAPELAFDQWRDELTAKLEALPDDQGRPMDVAPTILQALDIPIPADMRGSPVQAALPIAPARVAG